MSSQPLPPHDHDALLEALATGDLDPGSERARQELAGCPDCRAQAEVLLARVRRLEAAGREQRRELDEARALASAPGEDRVERARTLAGVGVEAPRRGLRLLAPLAAAALVLAGVGWWFTRSGRETPPGTGDGAQYLGAALKNLQPSGADRSFDVFTWEYDPGHTDGFVVRIYDAEHPDDALLEQQTPIPEWKPSPAERESLPDRIVWEVEALDAFGEVESGPVSASASRSLH